MRNATQTDKCYDFLANIARRGKPMPRDYEIAVAVNCAIGGVASCIVDLKRTNRITMESEGSGTAARRRVFVAGFWSDWTAKKANTGKYDADAPPQIKPEHDERMRGLRFDDMPLRRPVACPRPLRPATLFSVTPSSLGFAAT